MPPLPASSLRPSEQTRECEEQRADADKLQDDDRDTVATQE